VHIDVKPKYDIVLFDLDGTLIDSESGIITSIRHAIDAIGMEQPDQSEMVHFMGAPLRDSLIGVFGRPEEDVEIFFNAYKDVYFGNHEYDFEMYDGIRELVQDLHAAGVTVVLATAKPQESAERILERAELVDYFVYVAGSKSDGTRQDKAEVIAHAFDVLKERHGIDPNAARIAMIGDRDVDVHGARAHDLDFIGVRWGFGTEGEFEELEVQTTVNDTTALRSLLLG